MTHHHHHEHRHAGGHAHASDNFGAAFAFGTALNIALVAGEAWFGIFSNSLALIADAVHNLTDVLGLLLAWGGMWLATRQPTASRTYGYRRASILAALGNAMLLFVATGAILGEAMHRLFVPERVSASTVVWVAAAAIAINTGTALLFLRGREHDLNVKGAFLHRASDAATSLGVVIAALLISRTGWLWLDPAVSLAVGAYSLGYVEHDARGPQSRARCRATRQRPLCRGGLSRGIARRHGGA